MGGDNKFLREETVYSSKFSWVYILVLKEFGAPLPMEVFTTIFACFEVLRRFIWNFFRLENEHLNNCGKFRAVRDISVAPIDASDQQQIIKMMDEPDPSSLFRKKKVLKSQALVVDPLRVPLLKDTDEKPSGAVAALKTFHIGGRRRNKEADKLEEDLQKRLLDLNHHETA